MTQYYVKDKDKVYGPVSAGKVTDFVSKGFFSPECQVSTDRQNWVAAASAIELFPRQVVRLVKGGNPDADDKNTAALPQALPPVLQALPPQKSGSGLKIFIIILIVLILLVCGVVGFFAWKHFSKPAETFEQVSQKYGNCVGLVTVVLENDGKLMEIELGGRKISSVIPIGTAFAVSENQFVTNSHVAYGLKGQKKALVAKIVVAAAIANGVKTEAELKKFIDANAKDIQEIRKNLRVRSVEVRMSHSNGKRHEVKNIQVHPDYQSDVSVKEESRNAEFDIAILHVDGKTDNFFPLADQNMLHNLSAGQEIASLGFPMEGLRDDGGIDIKKPEAVFKSGTIGKITDFSNKVSGLPDDNKSITHDIPAAGGASGSPIFLKNGSVVAILWGVSHFSNNGSRQVSAAQHNQALRIDALKEVKSSKKYSCREWMGE